MEILFIFSCLIIFPNNSDFQFWKMSWGSFFYWPVGGVLIFLQQQIVETLKFSQFSFGKGAGGSENVSPFIHIIFPIQLSDCFYFQFWKTSRGECAPTK